MIQRRHSSCRLALSSLRRNRSCISTTIRPITTLVVVVVAAVVAVCQIRSCQSFVPTPTTPTTPTTIPSTLRTNGRRIDDNGSSWSPFQQTSRITTTATRIHANNNNNNLSDEEREQIEQSRLGVWKDRRRTIRNMLKSAESVRNFRIEEGFVDEIDEETGKPVKDGGGKSAVTFTAFAVAAGAVILRIGGRAALVSAVGLDFLTDNPELQNQVTQVLDYAETIDPLFKAGLFCLAWTAVKVFCVDGAGIVLALSSSLLFGGVFEGAFMSALGATIGSSVAFGMAKADTPLRKKALEIVEDNPSLRGIDKVVTEDGLKAVLTLRLCPILPIPLGLYNYVYGTTSVRYFDFAGGIFLGSLKPYLLDSYLGYFGKSLVDGTASQDGELQDYALIAALGISVLVGVFASELASETWDAVLEEQEAEEKARKEREGIDGEEEDTVVKEVFGFELPEWVVKFQYALKEAEDRMTDLILQEFDAQVWNETEELKFLGMMTVQEQTLQDDRNPAIVNANSPERAQAYQGFDFGAVTCDGLVLSPLLFTFFLQFADPLFDEVKFEEERRLEGKEKEKISPGLFKKESTVSSSSSIPSTSSSSSSSSSVPSSDTSSDDGDDGDDDAATTLSPKFAAMQVVVNAEIQRGMLLNKLQDLKDQTSKRLQEVDEKLDNLDTTNDRRLTDTTETTTPKSEVERR